MELSVYKIDGSESGKKVVLDEKTRTFSASSQMTTLYTLM